MRVDADDVLVAAIGLGALAFFVFCLFLGVLAIAP